MGRKMELLIVVLLAGWAAAGCGTLEIGGKPVIATRSEIDEGGKRVPMFGTAITVHQYGATQPQPSPPGTPPSPPPPKPPLAATGGEPLLLAQAVVTPPQRPQPSYQTIFVSKWDDPTLVIVKNDTPRFVWLKIDDAAEEIPLPPYSSTLDLSFDFGEHLIRQRIEVPTILGIKIVEREQRVSVRPNGRPQVIQIIGW